MKTRSRAAAFLGQCGLFLGQYGLYLLAGGLLFWKTYIFYSQIHLAGFELAFCLGTLCVVTLICGLLRLLSPKAAKIGFGILYFLAGFYMSVDSVYYAYVAKLPSMAQITMAWQIGGVANTVLNLINWKHIAMIFDFPLWFLYFVDRRKREKGTSFWGKKKQVTAMLSCAGCCVLVLVGWTVFGSFRPEYCINELFCYHTVDIVETLWDAANDEAVDKSQYTLRDDSDSDWFGLAEGRNVFVLQIEALQNFVIGAAYEGQVLTPNLNALLQTDTLYFPNYYYQIGGGNTADAEFTVNNSLFAPESQAAYVQYKDNHYHGLPWLLKDNGYSGAHVFHNYTKEFWNRQVAYPNQGFDSFVGLEDLELIDPFPMGISDRELFAQSMDYLLSYKQPFYTFFITVSSHHPYAIPLQDRGITLKPEDEGTLFGLYIQAVHYVDTVLGEWLELLKENGLYDNSIFVLYGDHYALTNTDAQIAGQVSSMLGRSYTIYDVFNVPMLMHIPGSGVTKTIETAGGHIDTLPTLLCLLGIDEVQTVMFGQNLLTATEGFVCEQTHMSIGSFISDEVFFKKPHNNLLTNYSVYERGTMAMLDPSLYEAQSDLATKRIEDCAALMARDDLWLD